MKLLSRTVAWKPVLSMAPPEPEMCRPQEKVKPVAEFFLNVQPLTVVKSARSPPPNARAVLPDSVQLLIVEKPSSLMPPPTRAELPDRVQLLIVAPPVSMPPPSPSVELQEMVQPLTVMWKPQMPPPSPERWKPLLKVAPGAELPDT